MDIESLRDSNQTYYGMWEYEMRKILFIRDNLTRQVFHWQIIGMMILFGSISVLLPVYLSSLLIFDHFMFFIFAVIIISVILLLNQIFSIPHSLINDYFNICNNAMDLINDYRLFFTHYTDTDLQVYERLGFFQYKIHLSQLVLMRDKFVQLTKHWTFFHDKKTRSDIKQINEKIIQIAKEKLKDIDKFTDVFKSSENHMTIKKYLDAIDVAKKQIGMKI